MGLKKWNYSNYYDFCQRFSIANKKDYEEASAADGFANDVS